MKSWRSLWSYAAFALPLVAAARADAAVPTRPLSLLVDQHFRMGQSVGSPTDGHLLGGSRLEEAPYLRFLPVYASEDARWGLGSLVALVDRSARAVRHAFPDAVLSVGQLSRRGGGDIDRHASHESGRDADLSFYIRSQTNHPLYSDHMVSFRGDGTAPSWPGAYFDDARNWTLVSSIVEDPHARVTYVFVAAPLRARLLAYAARVGAPLAVRNKAAELMVQPRGSLPHDDHFHVRIACPSGMSACVELPTRPKASRMVARRAAPAPALAAHAAVAKVAPASKASRAAHAPEPVDAPAAAPTTKVVHEAPASPPTPPPDPTVSAVLATPFDDVDGPVDVGPGARSSGGPVDHVDIQ
jgi:penicillin-insensitive murein endopeptidase